MRVQQHLRGADLKDKNDRFHLLPPPLIPTIRQGQAGSLSRQHELQIHCPTERKLLSFDAKPPDKLRQKGE